MDGKKTYIVEGVEFKKNDQLQMNKWLEGDKKYTILYKASRDGCCATTFHNRCNNRGPTVTLLYNTYDSVFGGYTSVSWRSVGGYQTDVKAFLFRLYNYANWSPAKMPVRNSSYSIYDVASSGPTFGSGPDLITFTGELQTHYEYFNLNRTANFGHSYDSNGQSSSSMSNGNMQIKDIEVYLIEDLPASSRPQEMKTISTDTKGQTNLLSSSLRKEPWRGTPGTPEWDEKLLNDLKEKIGLYQPLQELKVPQARLLLVGQVGAGKSSFFNTINSIFRGYITSQACSGNAEQSLTTVYRMYQVRHGLSGTPLNFRLHDTSGIEADRGIDAHEMCFLLDGHIPDRHQFNSSVPLSTDTPGFISSVHLSQKIHCVVFVIDGSTVDVIPEKVIERIKTLKSRMNQRGIPQVVLLTKIDKVCQATGEDLSMVFYSSVIQESVDKVSHVIGLPRSHIFPVKNYEAEMELNKNVNILTLLTLQQMLHFSDDYMCNYFDQIEDVKKKSIRLDAVTM